MTLDFVSDSFGKTETSARRQFCHVCAVKFTSSPSPFSIA